jgi:hypothetical protein
MPPLTVVLLEEEFFPLVGVFTDQLPPKLAMQFMVQEKYRP